MDKTIHIKIIVIKNMKVELERILFAKALILPQFATKTRVEKGELIQLTTLQQ